MGKVWTVLTYFFALLFLGLFIALCVVISNAVSSDDDKSGSIASIENLVPVTRNFNSYMNVFDSTSIGSKSQNGIAQKGPLFQDGATLMINISGNYSVSTTLLPNVIYRLLNVNGNNVMVNNLVPGQEYPLTLSKGDQLCIQAQYAGSLTYPEGTRLQISTVS